MAHPPVPELALETCDKLGVPRKPLLDRGVSHIDLLHHLVAAPLVRVSNLALPQVHIVQSLAPLLARLTCESGQIDAQAHRSCVGHLWVWLLRRRRRLFKLPWAFAPIRKDNSCLKNAARCGGQHPPKPPPTLPVFFWRGRKCVASRIKTPKPWLQVSVQWARTTLTNTYLPYPAPECSKECDTSLWPKKTSGLSETWGSSSEQKRRRPHLAEKSAGGRRGLPSDSTGH